MRIVSAKFVPKMLRMEQKQLHLEVSQDMLEYANSDPEFLNIVTTGDELWVYGYDPENKAQPSQWKLSTSPRPRMPGKCGATSKWCWSFCLTPVGWCITSTHYKTKTLTKNTTWKSFVAFVMCGAKRPDLWTAETWQLHHDNTPAHSSQLIQTFLAKHIPVVRQALYFPDMAPCDFWLFPRLETLLKSTWFESRDIIRNTTVELYYIRKEVCQKCFEQWRNRWEKGVQSQGDCFEGDYGCRPPGV